MADFMAYRAAYQKHQNEIMHHGVKGMHWGIRRYQNADGSLTPAGQKRYDKLSSKLDDANNKYYEHWKKSYGSENGKGKLSDRLKTAKYFKKTGKLMKKTGRYDIESPADRLKREQAANSKQQPFSKKDVEKLKNVRNTFKTDEAKDTWNRALETDHFDLDFLEKVQNKWFENPDVSETSKARTARLEEYAKYVNSKWSKKK